MNGEDKMRCATVSNSDATKQVIELSCGVGGINGSALLLKGQRTTMCEVEVYGKMRGHMAENI